MPALYERKTDISVIVPVYNLEPFIKPLLITLKDQQLDEYKAEYIFVLNNCTDNSEKVIRESGLDCKILSCKEQGCGLARNTGLEHAKGEYIWFMDGDDWLLSDTAIRDVLDTATEQHLDILRIPFDSDRFAWPYFSMVWQYLLRRDFISEFRFPAFQPGEDDAYMTEVLNKAGYDRETYVTMPCAIQPMYFYNYGRVGSNMYRFNRGERI